MELDELQRHWDRFGLTDPLWAILTDPSKKNGRWDLPGFLATGIEEIQTNLAHADTLARVPRRRALDFGCGVGRLTQALADAFDSAEGVDIAPSMIALADQYNRFPGRCHYHVNARDDLRLFDDGAFTFVYSNIVLQHMAPKYSRAYMREFLRILAPGGMAVFQIPDRRRTDEGAPDAARSVPPMPAPLGESGFKAHIAPHTKMPQVNSGERFEVVATITNESNLPWPRFVNDDLHHWIRLANRWLDAAGAVVVPQDARGDLPHALAPGQQTDVTLTATAPTKPGDYLLELDLVQEAVAWFADKGSPTARVPVRVISSGAGAPAVSGDSPRMEMHGVPRSEVEALMCDAGGTVADVTDGHCPGWESWRYWVVKNR